MGRRSGGITGIFVSTMDAGEFPVTTKALMTLSRLMARALRGPESEAMVWRSASTSAARSKVSSRFWMAEAPMSPLK